MGWFSRNDTQQTQQFGQPTMNAGSAGMGMGMMGMGMGGMDPTMGMGMMQNPMMQQMANDPIAATAKLLQLNDPVAQFITTQNMALVMDLIGEIVRLSIKDFFSQVSFKLDDSTGVLKLDMSTMPSEITTLSPENLGLTMTRMQSMAQQTLQMNEQQRMMFLQAHQMGGMNPQQQQGFFGSLLGGMLGNQVQQQGGFGQSMAKAGAMGAAVL